MELLVSLLLNLVIICVCGFLVKVEKMEKEDLLNRLMARDYREYATFKHVEEVDKTSQSSNNFFEEPDAVRID